MFARLSVDTGSVRDYGAACAGHASDLRRAAERLNTCGLGSAEMFGPIAARFLASLRKAADAEAQAVAGLSASSAAATEAASSSAHAYEVSDGDAAGRITGAS